MQCILLSSNGQCSAYPIAPMSNAVHTPQFQWAMQCIPHSSYGQCSAYPIAPMGNAVHTPLPLWAMQCIPQRPYGQCSAYPIAPLLRSMISNLRRQKRTLEGLWVSLVILEISYLL